MMRSFTILFAVLLCAASASSQRQWTKYAGNPVMSRGPSGAWDDFVVIPNRVVRVQDTLRMWYSGSRTGLTFNIGYAWSTNGGITWIRHPSNPIVTPTQSWEGINVGWPYVIFTGFGYRMWYLGQYDIGEATSPDGIVWTKYAGNPLVYHGRSAWDQYSVSWPSILVGYGELFMWFEGWNADRGSSQIGYGLSTDGGSSWTEVDSVNPVLKPVPGTWEPSNLRGPRVMFNSGHGQMWYTGGADVRGRGVGYATSPDGGITWVKDTLNPVLAPGPQGSWDAVNITLGDVLFDGGTYHMWYAGSAGTYAEIGYATAPLTSVGEVQGEIAKRFTLEQNYPNPFNPSTKIQFSIVNRQLTIVKVFDVLGRDVATLVNEVKEPGTHTVQFDGSHLSSGVYLCQMRAGSFVQTRKLLLLR